MSADVARLRGAGGTLDESGKVTDAPQSACPAARLRASGSRPAPVPARAATTSTSARSSPSLLPSHAGRSAPIGHPGPGQAAGGHATRARCQTMRRRIGAVDQRRKEFHASGWNFHAFRATGPTRDRLVTIRGLAADVTISSAAALVHEPPAALITAQLRTGSRSQPLNGDFASSHDPPFHIAPVRSERGRRPGTDTVVASATRTAERRADEEHIGVGQLTTVERSLPGRLPYPLERT